MKEEIRKELLKKRDLQSKEEILEKSRRIKDRLFSLDDFIKLDSILFYYSFRSEARTDVMIEDVLGKKRVFLPKVEDREIKVYEIKTQDELEEGFCRIKEPLPKRPILPEEIKMVIVPGVCFDKRGFRIGYGGGYYDRFLSLHSFQKIGLGFSLQIIDNVPNMPEDIRMDKIITEDFMYVFS